MPSIADIQTLLNQPADNTWSPLDQAALIKASDAVKRKIQALLGVVVDGRWGSQSQNKLNKLRAWSGDHWVFCQASSFADPADLASFKKCKTTGKTDVQCFAVGDNGIGQFGDITAQTHTPYVAVHKSFMIARWGSVLASAHRKVELLINGKSHVVIVGDRISAPGRIDLNPAAYLLWNLKAPLKIDAQWRWA